MKPTPATNDFNIFADCRAPSLCASAIALLVLAACGGTPPSNRTPTVGDPASTSATEGGTDQGGGGAGDTSTAPDRSSDILAGGDEPGGEPGAESPQTFGTAGLDPNTKARSCVTGVTSTGIVFNFSKSTPALANIAAVNINATGLAGFVQVQSTYPAASPKHTVRAEFPAGTLKIGMVFTITTKVLDATGKTIRTYVDTHSVADKSRAPSCI